MSIQSFNVMNYFNNSSIYQNYGYQQSQVYSGYQTQSSLFGGYSADFGCQQQPIFDMSCLFSLLLTSVLGQTPNNSAPVTTAFPCVNINNSDNIGQINIAQKSPNIILLGLLLQLLSKIKTANNPQQETTNDPVTQNFFSQLFSSSNQSINTEIKKPEIIKIVEKLTGYNEAAYLAANPDVAKAVAQGAFKSGYDHYLKHGINEGRSPEGNPDASPVTFNEQAYLEANPDVAKAVAQGAFKSGLEHFAQYGANEGRAPAPMQAAAAGSSSTPSNPAPVYNEAAYLAANPDVAAAVAKGDFKSGLDHFAAHGAAEGRAPNGN